MNRAGWIAVLSTIGIAAHLILNGFHLAPGSVARWPLYVVLAIGGGDLLWQLAAALLQGRWQTDLLAGISVITAVLLEQYLAGALVVLMFAGGEALEAFAVGRASSALASLAKRMPAIAHRRGENRLEDVAITQIAIGDLLVVLPHELCPVDGVVIDGHGSMDEAYLTGEPYQVSKAPGAVVLSGAINGESALTIRASKLAQDSRYAQIMQVMQESEHRRPQIRRLGDQLGAYYTPLAVGVALCAWLFSGEVERFLAVLVIATPCPLLIAIPVAIIGAISAAARTGIIIRDPVMLEQLDHCRIAIFDKTGTLTYGRPDLIGIVPATGVDEQQLLALVACLEQYSKHPLASAVMTAAASRQVVPLVATQVSEPPGQGLVGVINGQKIRITSRKQWLHDHPHDRELLPEIVPGMECIVAIDDTYAGALRFRDQPRRESQRFIAHLGQGHGLERVLLVSGDRQTEVEYLANLVGIREVHYDRSPEQKLELVRAAMATQPTLFVGDGINDAPSLRAATVGIAMGSANDVIADAAGAIVLDSSIVKVDELLHLARNFRRIALQSAIGGMACSVVGMIAASLGWLSPVSGALLQELIDVFAVLNALRAASKPNADR